MIPTVSSHATEAATAASSVSCRWLDWLRRWLRRVSIAASWLVLATLLYLAAGFGLAWIPTNTDFHPDRNGVEIAVVHNGVHADLLLPLRTPQHNWWELVYGHRRLVVAAKNPQPGSTPHGIGRLTIPSIQKVQSDFLRISDSPTLSAIVETRHDWPQATVYRYLTAPFIPEKVSP